MPSFNELPNHLFAEISETNVKARQLKEKIVEDRIESWQSLLTTSERSAWGYGAKLCFPVDTV